MKKSRKELLILIIACLFLQPSITAKEKLTWHVLHWPPIFILHGEDQEKGKYNETIKLFQNFLPQYEHETISMNILRFWKELKEKKKICSLFAFKTKERLKFTEFSNPVSIVLPNRIIMTKWKLIQLGSPSSYSLVRLMKDPRFKGRIIASRSYTKKLDEIIKKHEVNSNLKREVLNSENFIQMMLSDRIDYIIEYPFVIAWLEKRYSDFPGTLTTVSIEEMQPYEYSYFACPKSSWGRKIVTDFNQILKTILLTSEYQQTIESWHTNEKDIAFIREKYDELIEISEKNE